MLERMCTKKCDVFLLLLKEISQSLFGSVFSIQKNYQEERVLQRAKTWTGFEPRITSSRSQKCPSCHNYSH